MSKTHTGFTFTTIAETGDLFAAFGPCVPAMSEDGVVAFFAKLVSKRTALFTSKGGAPSSAIDSKVVGAHFASHADIDEKGRLYAYVDRGEEGGAVVVVEAGRVARAVVTGNTFSEIGPLGPTASEAGLVAFRAKNADGVPGMFTVGEDNSITTIAVADGSRIRGFQGLPLVNRHGAVVFRADYHDGTQVIHQSRNGSVVALATSGRDFLELGYFPSSNDEGRVAFIATTSRGSGVFLASEKGFKPLVESGARFESFRSALLARSDALVFLATPKGGTLGLYASTDPAAPPILQAGERLLGSTVAELAVNPVSINGRGQLAILVRLSDGREVILRADPPR